MSDSARIERIVSALRELGFEVNPENLFFDLVGVEVPVERLIDESMSWLLELRRDGKLFPVINFGPKDGKWKICETHMVAIPVGDRRGCPVCSHRPQEAIRE